MNGSKFLQKFLQTEIIGLGFGVPVASAYVLLLLDMSPDNVTRIIRFVIVTALAVVGGAAMPMNLYLGQSIRKQLERFDAGKSGGNEIKKLYLKITGLPLLHSILLFLRIFIGALVVIAYMFFGLKIQGIKCLMSVALAVYGSYLAAIIAYIATSVLIRPIGNRIVCGDYLERRFIEGRKIFGLGVIKRSMLFLVVPMVLTNITVFFSLYSGYISNIGIDSLLRRTGGVIIVNTLTMLISILLTLFMMRRPIDTLKGSLEKLSDGRDDTDESLPTDLSDDFAYISYLINIAVFNFKNIIAEVTRASSLLSVSVNELSASSSQLSSTSNQQAAAVKEIVSTMEDSDQLARNIAEKVKQVSEVAENTSETVVSGEKKVQMSLAKMEEIGEANARSIEGLRSLGDKINSIWDILNIINSVANQTKIIAFNAELEASAAGDAGKNFQIVATEIRRLADNTVASTAEIRNKINEIQQSSDEVITASEEGTSIINEGRNISQDLYKVFSRIKEAAENSADSAGNIEGSVNQQVASFEQILMTLRMISDGIDNFVVSANAGSSSSSQLKEMAESLNRLIKTREQTDPIQGVKG